MNNQESYRALLIGVCDYGEDSGFDRLLGPPNDIKGMNQALQDPSAGLFTVKTLLNPATGPLRTSIQKFLSQANSDDHLLLYYSGHGEISGHSGQLCLTSREGEREALDGSSQRFDEMYEWIRTSPARSVIVILDCCRAGSGFKGGAPDFTSYFDRAPGIGDSEDKPEFTKAIKVLAAVPSYTTTADALSATEMSPFTADLYRALASDAPPDQRGLITLSSVLKVVRDLAVSRGSPLPQAWGTDTGQDPYIAMRPHYMRQLLHAAGLGETNLMRRGAAYLNDEEIHCEIDQVEQLVGHFQQLHPTVATVGGLVSTGKTWILCDVRDQLTAAGWNVVTLEPAQLTIDPDHLRIALKKYALGLLDRDEPNLIIIDSLEWNEDWAEFVASLDDFTTIDDDSAFGVSVLAAMEGRSVQGADARGVAPAPGPEPAIYFSKRSG